MGKILNSIVIGYNLKTVNDIDKTNWNLQNHILSVTGNKFMMLDMAPGVNPIPQQWEIAEYLENCWDPHP
jgi:hypothetical protein